VLCVDASETCLYRKSPLFFSACPTPNRLQRIFIWRGHLITATENLFYHLCGKVVLRNTGCGTTIRYRCVLLNTAVVQETRPNLGKASMRTGLPQVWSNYWEWVQVRDLRWKFLWLKVVTVATQEWVKEMLSGVLLSIMSSGT